MELLSCYKLQKNIVFDENLVGLGRLTDTWQFCMLFHLEPSDFVRTKGVRYGNTRSKIWGG